MKKVKIGLLGFGNVGGGTYKILTDNRDIIEERTGLSPEIVRILQRNRKKKRLVEADPALLTEDPDDIIKDPDIDIVVEMLGGIEPATSFMLQSMKHGKHVVSANKAAIAANYDLLIRTARENNVEFLFEASVAGGIPVLTAMTGALAANNFVEVMGILNGTTNYILTKMTDEGLSYEAVLRDAQEKGFAEADPTADVEGIDAANKLSILIALAFGEYVAPDNIPTEGITAITASDIEKADAEGKKIKLIGQARVADGRLDYSVKPVLLDKDHPLAGVSNEFNAVYITGDMAGELMFYGRGAGPLPTGSAVCGDILAIMKKRF
ncbi:MAG: homoserine dehydrogenase [Anaerovoracaceae bacterium]|nr:homoserine dehydrogenase [Anaerovoracaceae bacterium]